MANSFLHAEISDGPYKGLTIGEAMQLGVVTEVHGQKVAIDRNLIFQNRIDIATKEIERQQGIITDTKEMMQDG